MSQNLLDSDDTAVESPDVPQEPSRRHCLYKNLRAFFSSFLALAYKPRRFAPLVVDYWLLVQSIWSGRQLGPDVVYPMLSIRKRQSGRLARLILEHSRAVHRYELRTATPFPQGIDPPCVAVIDLDDVPHYVVENRYSTQVDLYGLMCLFILFETLVTFTVHVFYLFDWGWVTWVNWGYCALYNLIFGLYAVFRGDGTLTLARRSNTSTPGCAVLLDQDFTVVLDGSQSVVEAIAEGSFNLSHPNSIWRLRLNGEDDDRDSSYDLLEALCEGVCLVIFASCWLLFRPSTTLGGLAPILVVCFIGGILQRSPPDHFTALQGAWFTLKGAAFRGLPPLSLLTLYEQAMIQSSFFAFDWQRSLHSLSVFLIAPFWAGYRTRNYPIRTAKFLDALGHPYVRKWEFDTLAAAATFQCLVICHGTPRPIRSIDVLALLDMFVPDQRGVWKAWKERVADRIVHETNISYAPTIATFGDERQQQLKDLLDQAELGDYAYRSSYVRSRVPRICSRRRPVGDSPLPIPTVV